jgi:hypothetical protein
MAIYKTIKLRKMKRLKQVTTFWLLALLLVLAACQKDTTPAPVMVPVSLQEYVNTHLPAAQREQLAWGSAKAITQRGKVAGYSIPMANRQSRLVAIATPEGWLCNRMGSNATEVWLEDLGQTTRVVSRIAAGKVVATTKYHHGQEQEETGLSIAISGNPQTVSHNGIPYFLLTSSTSTGSPASPVYYITADDGNGGNGGGGFNSPSLITVNFDYLAEELDLNPMEYYWLFSHAMEASQTYVYLTTSSQAEKKVIAKEHINEMIYNAQYRSFAEGHTQTGDATKVWWEDSSWVRNPDHFTLALEPEDGPRAKLTALEIGLLSVLPVQSAIVFHNTLTAKEITDVEMGPGDTKGINDRKAAYGQALLRALNVRDLPSRIITPLSNVEMTRLFVYARDNELPPHMNLEKEVRAYNSDIGIEYGTLISSSTSNAEMRSTIKSILLWGKLQFLHPIRFDLYPYFDPYDPSNLNNRNGIVPDGLNKTKKYMTNQYPTN